MGDLPPSKWYLEVILPATQASGNGDLHVTQDTSISKARDIISWVMLEQLGSFNKYSLALAGQ